MEEKMIINGQYIPAAAQDAASASPTGGKSLVDYMNEKDKDDKSSYFSDRVSLSKEAYAAIREYDPSMLKNFNLAEDDSFKSSTGSVLDKVQLSEEAVNALRERNPELLKSLGYDTEEV